MGTRSALAVLACALLACIVAGFIVLPQLFGNGVTIAPISTSPSASTPSEGGMLLQYGDIPLGLNPQDSEHRDDGTARLTSCTRHQTMAGLTKHAVDNSYASAIWRSPATGAKAPVTLTESVSRGRFPAATRDAFAELVAKLARCRYRHHGHRGRLSGPVRVRTGEGNAVRFIGYDADGTAVGGIGVFQNGTALGVLELVGTGSTKPGAVLDLLVACAVRQVS